jgi:hypothetical protein
LRVAPEGWRKSGFWSDPIARQIRDWSIVMPYKVKYEKRRGYLYALMEGPESHQAAVQFWENLSKKSEAEDISYFLIVDKVFGTLNKVQLLAVSETVARLFSGKTIAYVDPKYYSFKDNQLGETVVNDRGGNAKVFHAETEALDWLVEMMTSDASK